MLGKVYIFEREQRPGDHRPAGALSPWVRAAIRAAAKSNSGIRIEELTDPHNARPVVAILFEGAVPTEPFERRLKALLAKDGVRVRVIRSAGDRSTTRTRDTRFNAPPFAA